MEIVNIEAGTFREMTTSIRLLKEKLENLKSRQTSKSLDGWMDLDGQSGSMHGTEHIAENIAGPEKQRYLALLPD